MVMIPHIRDAIANFANSLGDDIDPNMIVGIELYKLGASVPIKTAYPFLMFENKFFLQKKILILYSFFIRKKRIIPLINIGHVEDMTTRLISSGSCTAKIITNKLMTLDNILAYARNFVSAKD
ncbi:hypothetical protein XBFM1_1910039 [Xenorhabdus bovienii str. feltiae Moldova]|uniref:Uncharacterized protein n=1 Tax=Xenorhabdus bovienii str. feltiae Moldova TaxID=1398200 RepID=A0A077NR32_XENBV|nr:hypothetical protein XBFM1_1910039 [Xenorhabdus bovienii str. feltiae Moldova]